MEELTIKKPKKRSNKKKSTDAELKKRRSRKELNAPNFESLAFQYDDGKQGLNINVIVKTCLTILSFILVLSGVLIFMFIRDNKKKDNKSLFIMNETTKETIDYNYVIPIYDLTNSETTNIEKEIEKETETETEKIVKFETEAQTESKNTSKDKKIEKTIKIETTQETEIEYEKETEEYIDEYEDYIEETTEEEIEETTRETKKETKKVVRNLKPEDVFPNFSTKLYSEAALLEYNDEELKKVHALFKIYAESDDYKKLPDSRKYLVAANMKFIEDTIKAYKKNDHEKFLALNKKIKYLDIVKSTVRNDSNDDSKFYYRSLPMASAMNKAIDRGLYYEVPTTTYAYENSKGKYTELSKENICILKNARVGYGENLSDMARDYLLYPDRIGYEMYPKVQDVCKGTAKNPNLLIEALVSQQQIFDSNGFVIALINID